MKHIIIISSLATTTTLLLLLFSPPTTTASGGDNAVYNVIGDPLKAGQDYYIVPYSYDNVGGGFTWKLKQQFLAICPHYYVLQLEDNLNFGEPTSFYPLNSNQNDISLSTQLNIVFTKASPPASPPFVCPSSSNVWKVVADDATGILYVELGGRKGTRDINSWFSIEELDEGGYQIKFCPRSGRPGCGGLGIVYNDGGRYLGVNGTHPLAFAFEDQANPINNV